MRPTNVQHSLGSKFSSLALTICLAISFLVPASGQSQTSGCSPEPKSRKWHKYVNSQYGFSFWYPEPYKIVSLPPADSGDKYRYHTFFEKRLLLLQRTDNPDAQIWVKIDMRPFDLETLANTYAPTGASDNTPPGQKIANHIFYSYGAGGGGVVYPDQYFVNLKNKTLQFEFDGPYQGKSPDGETRDLEPEILQTFRVH